MNTKPKTKPHTTPLRRFQRLLIRELESLGFKYPECDVNGGDAVEYLSLLYHDLKKAVRK